MTDRRQPEPDTLAMAMGRLREAAFRYAALACLPVPLQRRMGITAAITAARRAEEEAHKRRMRGE